MNAFVTVIYVTMKWDPWKQAQLQKLQRLKVHTFVRKRRLEIGYKYALETVWLTFFLFVYQKNLAKGIMCYYCNSNDGECSEDEYGTLVSCQEDNDHVAHFGDACVIGRTGGKNYI